MNTFFRACSISVILLLSIASSAHSSDRDEREQRREARSEQRQHDRASNQERQVDAQQMQPDAQPHPHQSETGKRPGRMTPEERRALRRQINEAGQDIYTKKQ